MESAAEVGASLFGIAPEEAEGKGGRRANGLMGPLEVPRIVHEFSLVHHRARHSCFPHLE